MTDFELEFQKFGAFDVARTHGINALRHLAAAHRQCGKWEILREEVREQTHEEMAQDAGAKLSQKESAEEIAAQHLFASVILFQASMESILLMTAGHDDRVKRSTDEEDSFARQWRAALQNVGEGTDAFDRYKDEVYDQYRKPLVHLGNEDDLKKVNSITFRDVYCGIRAGWWAYDMLLDGIGLTAGEHEESWEILCSLVGLESNLYPNDQLLSGES